MAERTGAQPRRLEWLRDWDRQVEPDRQASYMEAELRRLAEAGEPLLHAALMLPFMEQTDLAVRVLRTRLGYVHAYLRLAPAAAPPPATDPDGKELPPEKAGRVLVAKVGVLGQTPDGRPPHSEAESPYTSASGRDALANRLGRSLVRALEVGAAPVPVPLDDAIVILRQWGVGIPPEFRRRRSRTREAMACWLVEELGQRHGQPVLDAPGSALPPKAAPKSRAAA